MINFESLQRDLSVTPLIESYSDLKQAVEQRFEQYRHGEMAQWQRLLDGLPDISTENVNFDNSLRIGSAEELKAALTPTQIKQMINQIKSLHPWRKGPIRLFDILIDTEWRSDWKWDRLLPHLSPLKNRTVLDVGCGNGYHCFRMLAQSPRLVLGIDPSQKFLAQFSLIKKYLSQSPVHLLPLGIEDMPKSIQNPGFDTIFSMGVLYHRRSPIDHIMDLKDLLAKDGELILETLVVDGDENTVLVPRGRYAQMRNVWFLPSTKALEKWIYKCGFRQVKTVDVNQTSIEEQRSTEWMTFHSLNNYLDPGDPNKTIEGYPAPKRAILIAS